MIDFDLEARTLLLSRAVPTAQLNMLVGENVGSEYTYTLYLTLNQD